MCIKDVDKINRKVSLKPFNVRVTAMENLLKVIKLHLQHLSHLLKSSRLFLKLMATKYLHNLWISCDFIEDGHLRPDIKRVDQEVFLLSRDLNQARKAKIGSGGKY